MASNTTTELLPGQSAPLTVISSTDQSGVVLISTALAMTFGLVSILIRIFIRLDFRHQFSKDDIIAIVAMVFAVFQSSAVFVEVSKGFGKTIADVSPTHLVQLQKAVYASEILYIITIGLTKCSVGFLFLRLSPDKRHNLLSYSIVLASTVLMLISVFIVALRCNLTQPWIFINEQCVNLLLRWQVVAAFNIVTEIALFSSSIYLVKGLQLSMSKKSVVCLAFGLRLLVIIPTIFRLHYLKIEFASSDPTLDGVLASVCLQIELSFTIISATTPCLRPFMTALSTNYGAPAKNQNPTYAVGTGRSNNSYSLGSLVNKPSLGQLGKAKDAPSPRTRWDVSDHHASVMSGTKHSMESHESRQMIISKHTEWAVEHTGQRGIRTPEEGT